MYRALLDDYKVKLAMNLMSSPGSGKTTTLLATIQRLKGKYRIAVMEADIDSDVDAKKNCHNGRRVYSASHGWYVPLGCRYDRAGTGRTQNRKY